MMKKYLAFILVLLLSFPLTLSAKKTDSDEFDTDEIFNSVLNEIHDHIDFHNENLYYKIPILYECCLESTILYIEKKHEDELTCEEIIEKFFLQHVCNEHDEKILVLDDCSNFTHDSVCTQDIDINDLDIITTDIKKLERLMEEFIVSDSVLSMTTVCKPCSLVLLEKHVVRRDACSNYCYSYSITEVVQCIYCKTKYTQSDITGLCHMFEFIGSSYSTPDCKPIHQAMFHNIVFTKKYKCTSPYYNCGYTKNETSIVGQVYCYGF